MSRRKPKRGVRLIELPDILPGKLPAPLGIIMGTPRETAGFFGKRPSGDDLCWHMDLHPAERVREEWDKQEIAAKIVTTPDLWDVQPPLQTLIYPVASGGERALKLDLVEQAFHTLEPGGHFIVITPSPKDQLFPPLLKKIFGKVHVPEAGRSSVYWCQRQGERPQRRHEVLFHVQQEDGPSLKFISRPGVFSYGRFDNGARALTEEMEIHEGDKILDLGCGCGTNGVIAGVRSGPKGSVVFVDSNVRATTLAELNATANGVATFRVLADSRLYDLDENDFDVALANPPYFAQQKIAWLFIERAATLLRTGGRLHLVTKQPNELIPLLQDCFADVQAVIHRGYFVLTAVT